MGVRQPRRPVCECRRARTGGHRRGERRGRTPRAHRRRSPGEQRQRLSWLAAVRPGAERSLAARWRLASARWRWLRGGPRRTSHRSVPERAAHPLAGSTCPSDSWQRCFARGFQYTGHRPRTPIGSMAHGRPAGSLGRSRGSLDETTADQRASCRLAGLGGRSQVETTPGRAAPALPEQQVRGNGARPCLVSFPLPFAARPGRMALRTAQLLKHNNPPACARDGARFLSGVLRARASETR